MHGGFIATNVHVRNTKVIQLLFMCKTKDGKQYAPSAGSPIWSRMVSA